MSHENQTSQCASCANFQPKPEPKPKPEPPGLERHSTGVLLAGLGLALEGAARALVARGCGDVAAPLAIGARYVREVGRRMDAEASKAPEAQSRAETPAGANLDSEAVPGAGDGVGPGCIVSPFPFPPKGGAQ